MKKHSTGALSAEERVAQDRLYEDRQRRAVPYDYLFVGTGNAALTCAALLAGRGYRVCMLEAHDVPGGYAHTFRMGEYHFCAQVHYIWGCGEGGRINAFLSHLGLENEITFELFDKSGYDHMVMPDGKCVNIPYGWDALRANILAAYPQTTGLDEFLDIVRKLRSESCNLPRKIHRWDIVLKGRFYPTLMRYRNSTVQDLFDECGVSVEARTVLMAQAGDLLLPPNRLSILFYVGLLAGYGTGAWSPTKHFRFYIDRLARFIRDRGGDIFLEEQVTAISSGRNRILGVTTATGKVFTAQHYVCGMDPQAAAQLIGLEHFPRRYRKRLGYDYSDTGIMVYLGLDNTFEPQRYGLGNHNTWHCLDWDMNTMWEAGRSMDVDRSWFFLSTPTLHSDAPGIAPPNCHILEIGTFVPYAPFKEALAKSYHDYAVLKMGLAERLINLVAKHHIPDLRHHIVIRVVGSPTTNEDFCLSPFGNAYGSSMTPANAVTRLKAETPFANLHWCNASSGSPGIYGTVLTGMDLYMDLTGDIFYDARTAPTDEALIAAL